MDPRSTAGSVSPVPPLGRPTIWSDTGGQYEYRVITVPRDSDRSQTRRWLTDEAEYGRWELARSSIYLGGIQRVWLRRKIIRVRSTL